MTRGELKIHRRGHRRWLGALTVILFTACSGPLASDAAICRDWIARVCAAPRCEQVTISLEVGDDCSEVLLARSGCAAEGFTFTSVMRERFLNCRLPLLRGGRTEPVAPDCIDLSQAFDQCTDVTRIFADGGTP
ncbi:MAG: hypothetical protein ACT4TC_01095 [Myxococcaceae bacterium]